MPRRKPSPPMPDPQEYRKVTLLDLKLGLVQLTPEEEERVFRAFWPIIERYLREHRDL